MPHVRFKRQVTLAPGSCPISYQWHACNNSQVVWAGCCAQEACTTGCPTDARLDGGDADDDKEEATSTTLSNTTSITSTTRTSPPGGSIASPRTSAPTVELLPTAKSPSSATSTGTALGDEIPAVVLSDPSTQTVTGYEDAKPEEPHSPPHTEASDIPAIIGATIGALGLVALISGLFFWYRKRGRRRLQNQRVGHAQKCDQDHGDGPTDYEQTGASGGHIQTSIHQHGFNSSNNLEMHSVNGISTQDSKVKPSSVISSITTAPKTHRRPIHEVEGEGSTLPSVHKESVSTRTVHAENIPSTNNATLSGDPTAWSRFKNDTHSHTPVSSQMSSNDPPRNAPRTTNSIPPSELQLNSEKLSTDPYTGGARFSRATGSAFTPTHGATTTSTTTIHAA